MQKRVLVVVVGAGVDVMLRKRKRTMGEVIDPCQRSELEFASTLGTLGRRRPPHRFASSALQPYTTRHHNIIGMNCRVATLIRFQLVIKAVHHRWREDKGEQRSSRYNIDGHMVIYRYTAHALQHG